RAVMTPFMENVGCAKIPVKKCFNCLEHCDPRTTPYCITKALIEAVKGNAKEGLVFCGDNVHRLKEMTTVKDIFNELVF
ncbi:MAG TPA: nitronate monooxygenase, partial [Mobilitalea sp.]|nr:nitronate monooxygenase [Mobilitalea sp.]